MQNDSPKLKPKAGRIIGIDYGLVRIGLAVSDEKKIIASSLKTFLADKKAEHTARKLMDELNSHAKDYQYEIEEIVIGMPLMMNGKKGMLADEVTHFVSLLKELIPAPIAIWDERLSSVQADRSLREGNFSRKKRSKMIDGVAAVIILQSYLDSKAILK